MRLTPAAASRPPKKAALKQGTDAAFFLMAAHQLKAPLAIMEWCLQSVSESAALTAKEKELLGKANAQAKAMSMLIGDMLQVVRLINRKRSLDEYSSVDLTQLLGQLLVDFEMIAHVKGVHLEKGPLEILPPVYAEASYLKQAFANLLDNAIKYTPEGGRVTVSASRRGTWAEVTVSDQGIGISQADQSRLFSDFFRSQEAKEMTSNGSGLGLVLVKGIVEEFGGEILVESRLHRGSVFIVRLPLQ